MTVLLMTKLKNGLKKKGDFQFELSNINVNGSKRGCSGFVINLQNGVVVYVNTEKSCYEPLSRKNLVRYARNTKDYRGCVNEFATDEEVVNKIISMLNDENRYKDYLEL